MGYGMRVPSSQSRWSLTMIAGHCIVAVLTASPPATSFAQTSAGESVYAAVSPSVFLINTTGPDGAVNGTGTGFLVQPTKILTNHHVARNGAMKVMFGGFEIPCDVERSDVVNDLAICTLSAKSTARPLTLASVEPAPGGTVFAIGNPRGLERTISEGLFTGRRQIDGRALVQLSASISPGSSGGPIVDVSGQVVAIAVGQISGGQNLNFGVPLEIVRDFLLNRPTEAGTADTLASLRRLVEEQEHAAYSEVEDSPYQRKEREVESLLNQVLARSDNDAELKSAYALAGWLRSSFQVRAARKRLQLAKSGTAAMYFDLAHALYMEFDAAAPEMKEAEDVARRAVAMEKANFDYVYLLGRIQSYLGKPKEAYATFLSLTMSPHKPTQDVYLSLLRTSHALAMPKDTDRWYAAVRASGELGTWQLKEIADIFVEQSRFAEAATIYMEWASRVPKAFEPICSAGAMHWAADADDKALSASRECIARGAGDPSAIVEMKYAHFRIAYILEGRGVFDEALNHSRQAVALDADYAPGHYVMAKSLVGMRRWSEAESSARTAIRLSDGNDRGSHFVLGSAYFGQEKFVEAAESYKRAADLDPADVAAAYNVAASYYNARYWGDALRWYREVARRDPNYERAKVSRMIAQLSK